MHFDLISTQTHKETSRERRSFLHPQIWSKVQLTELLSPLSPKQSKSGYFSGKKNSRTWVRPYILISIHITIHSISWAQQGGIKLLQFTKSNSEFTPSVLLLPLHISLFKPLYHPNPFDNRPTPLNQKYSTTIALLVCCSSPRPKMQGSKVTVSQTSSKLTEFYASVICNSITPNLTAHLGTHSSPNSTQQKD
jgi:hypothetical protein